MAAGRKHRENGKVQMHEMREGEMQRMNAESNFKINVETEGFEEAQEQIEALAEAYDGFPAQVTIKNCHHCKISIYPSQTKYIDVKGNDKGDAE